MSNPSFINFLLAFFLIYNSASCQTKKTKEINTCIVSKSVNNYYSTIKGDSLVYLIAKSSDECNLKLVDSLIENFIRNGGKQDYEMLQNLSNLSDGYLSEYFVEKISKIYIKNLCYFLITYILLILRK